MDGTPRKPRSRGSRCRTPEEYLSFLQEIERAVPAELDVHCIADNYATHNHPKVKAWLAAQPHAHAHLGQSASAMRMMGRKTPEMIAHSVVCRPVRAEIASLAQKLST
jgi:putative transposase